VPALILSPRFSIDSRQLYKAAARAKWEVFRLKWGEVPAELWQRTDFAVYGEHLFCEFLQQELKFRLLSPPDDLLIRLPSDLVRRKITMMTYAEARRLKHASFIKPPDFKSFKAAVYQSGAELLDEPELSPTLVLVSEPVAFEIEFRCFVDNGRLVVSSAYAKNGILNVQEQGADEDWGATEEQISNAHAVVDQVLGMDLGLPRTVALDVGLIKDRGWAVVEANAAWGSGIYGCDPDVILPILLNAIEFKKST